MDLEKIFKDLGVNKTNPATALGSRWLGGSSSKISSYSPVNGELIGTTGFSSEKEFGEVISKK